MLGGVRGLFRGRLRLVGDLGRIALGRFVLVLDSGMVRNPGLVVAAFGNDIYRRGIV